MKELSIELFLRRGSADKVYRASLVRFEKDVDTSGWFVNFAYGRRNHSLKAGTKTARPVSYDVAKKLYDKLVTSKVAKGYTQSATGAAFSTDKHAGEVTGWIPQLLNSITLDELPDIYRQWNQNMYLQVKHDGERRGIVITDDAIVPSNRRGLRTTIDPKISGDLNVLCAGHSWDGVLDCEDMGDHLVIFDLVDSGMSNDMFEHRNVELQILEDTIEDLKLEHLTVERPVFPTCFQDVLNFVDLCRDYKEEGVVFRNGRAPYTPGRPNSGGDCLKFKFVERATVVVYAHNIGKRSVEMRIRDVGGHWYTIGNCTIPPNYSIPPVDATIDVEYLHAFRGGSLYQPVYKGERTDITWEAAKDSQLKYKD